MKKSFLKISVKFRDYTFAHLLLHLSIALLSTPAMAIPLKAQCYQVDAADQKVHGVGNKRIEIASVSKVITAFWALKEYGPEYRFKTRILISKLDSNLADVHIQGSQDPYFGKEKLQIIAAKLNDLGITKIRLLTFDENFKYIEFPQSEGIAHRYFKTTFPNETEVEANLNRSLKQLDRGYPINAKKLEAAFKDYKIDLPSSITLEVKEVKFIASAAVNQEALKNALAYSLLSTTLVEILKEINRNSNNYSSSVLFESLGGDKAFADFIYKELKLTEKDIIMYSGSGDKYLEDSSVKKYNEATCESLLKILHAMRSALKIHKLNLEDVMAVVGKDVQSTVHVYDNSLTKGAVVAKTGYVIPSIALAGMVSTKNGMILFASIYGPAVGRVKAGRTEITGDLSDIIKQNGGPVELTYSPHAFYDVDQVTFLELFKSLTKDAIQAPLDVKKP